MEAKMRLSWGLILSVLAVALWDVGTIAQERKGMPGANPVGIFEGHEDVGNVGAAYKGGVQYDAANGTYTVAGSGENMWFGVDAFHFAWTKASGDVVISADIAFLGAGKNPHRKAVLMVRQSLEADSAYADVAVHGVGLTSLQFRDAAGTTTHEVQANVESPKRVRIVKSGDYFTMWIADENGKFVLAGASPAIPLKPPFYVGIGVCSHEKDLVEKAVFGKVEVKETPTVLLESGPVLKAGGPPIARPHYWTTAGAGVSPKLYSILEVISADSGDRRALYVAEGRFEAPNWMPDGKRLLFNRDGKIETLEIESGKLATIDTGFAVRCNNDHGISRDGLVLVVSDQSQRPDHLSQIYLVPIRSGKPMLVTENAPSYWHGWSPDGKTLAFVGQRNGEFDIYTMPAVAGGGEERRLTTAKGLDDGPEYTPDGSYIYFNSVRTGHMQIWRMKADGNEQQQVTFGAGNDWFPHFSPDGKWMVFLTCDATVEGHPENKDVTLRIMSMADGKITELAKLYGGQGTINVPSWAPDGKRFAFVSYAWVAED